MEEQKESVEDLRKIFEDAAISAKEIIIIHNSLLRFVTRHNVKIERFE